MPSRYPSLSLADHAGARVDYDTVTRKHPCLLRADLIDALLSPVPASITPHSIKQSNLAAENLDLGSSNAFGWPVASDSSQDGYDSNSDPDEGDEYSPVWLANGTSNLLELRTVAPSQAFNLPTPPNAKVATSLYNSSLLANNLPNMAVDNF